MGTQGSPVKSYDYLLKFLLVGDSDVGKGEILESLQDGASESPYAYSNGNGERGMGAAARGAQRCGPSGCFAFSFVGLLLSGSRAWFLRAQAVGRPRLFLKILKIHRRIWPERGQCLM